MPYCYACGEKLPENALFCPKCGAKVVATAGSAAAGSPADEVRDAFNRMSLEMEKAFNVAAREMQQAFETARSEFQKNIHGSAAVCGKCGARNVSSADYCYKCGTKLASQPAGQKEGGQPA